MRKSLLVLLLWAPLTMAMIPQPGQRLEQATQQAIQHFLLHNRILDTAQDLDNAPYIVAADAGRVLGANGERVYARGVLDPTQPQYGIFRRGKAYTDPDTQELLGINADDIGTARFVMAGDLTTLAVQRVTQEVRPGDRLLRAEPPAEPATLKPARFVQGHIIDVPKGVTQIGVLDAVTLNKGRRDGLVEGQLLAVIKAGASVRDTLTGASTQLPDERAGTLVVFRTYEKLSYGLVLSASRALAVRDRFETAQQTQ
ncbi:peptidoglycan-binding protein [Pseudomonas sp. IB20]|uniref:peptidoglycan-binding protein n=1 Tax=Pseudomonas TaxID=286 RepID=UPI000BA105C6|nr:MULTISPECIES: peptidoglycan-binding protein [unclassified Pseudomonas]MCV2227796.1 peptidoglycan-binding protein [Pseudomonas sp. AU10]OZO05482.1 peptidoglycan-binding protein [Pseudomonas sp. IB20]